MNCDNCPNYINRGPTMVPYQEGWVSAGDDWECGKGLDPDECDPDDHHNTVRSYNRADEWGDIQGHMDREEGRRRWATRMLMGHGCVPIVAVSVAHILAIGASIVVRHTSTK